jgi:SAM-dependent methyltransferase
MDILDRNMAVPTGDFSNILERTDCDLCGSSEHDLLFRKRENRSWWLDRCRREPRIDPDLSFSIVRCRQCSHVYVNPRLTIDIITDIYENYWRDHKPADLERDGHGNYVWRQLMSMGDIESVLDFGCGWGGYLTEAKALGLDAVGIEIDHRKISFLKERGLNAVYGDILERPFAAETFDAVVAEQVFEHLYEPGRYLDEIRRVLKPGGLVYVAVPNLGGLAATFRGKNWDMVHPASHVRYFNRQRLATFLEEHGFVVLPPRYLRRFRSPLKNIAHKAQVLLQRSFGYYPLGLSLYARKSA